jgi:hypothetical protein
MGVQQTWTSHAPDICRDFITAYKANPQMKLFLFLNKADGLSTDEEADGQSPFLLISPSSTKGFSYF